MTVLAVALAKGDIPPKPAESNGRFPVAPLASGAVWTHRRAWNWPDHRDPSAPCRLRHGPEPIKQTPAGEVTTFTASKDRLTPHW